jgi:hypothetical protein
MQQNMPNPYTLRTTYVPIDDRYEPNDTRAEAQPIALGAPVRAFMFAGFRSSIAPRREAWEDWFKVTLAAGSVQIALTDVPRTIDGTLMMTDGNGAAVGILSVSSRPGMSVTFSHTGLAAGDYDIVVEPLAIIEPHGAGSTPAPYVIGPYTLSVTQP